jgi:hypothetical protein
MVLGSEIRKKPIPDPGSRGQKAPDPGSGSATLVLKVYDENSRIRSRIRTKMSRIRNTARFYLFFSRNTRYRYLPRTTRS